VRIAIIGDIHGYHERLDETLRLLAERPVELTLLTGDVGLDPPRFGRDSRRSAHDESVRHTVARIGETLGSPVVFVPGNHDMRDPPSDIAHNVDGTTLEVAGLRIAGLGGSGPAQFGFPYEWTEREVIPVLARFTAPLDILLCHTPPANSQLDKTSSGSHVGSTAVARAIARLQPRLFVCGHIHEAFGTQTIDGVSCLNAGALGEPFGQVLGWIVDWDDDTLRITACQP